jgi:hypothetical protein
MGGGGVGEGWGRLSLLLDKQKRLQKIILFIDKLLETFLNNYFN